VRAARQRKDSAAKDSAAKDPGRARSDKGASVGYASSSRARPAPKRSCSPIAKVLAGAPAGRPRSEKLADAFMPTADLPREVYAAWTKSRREERKKSGGQLALSWAAASKVTAEPRGDHRARAEGHARLSGSRPTPWRGLLLAERARPWPTSRPVGGRRSRFGRCSSSAVTPRRAAERFQEQHTRRPRAS